MTFAPSSSPFASLDAWLHPMTPVAILALVALITIPTLLRSNARVESVGYAAYCCFAQMFGVLLMSAGALPALYAVFAGEPLGEAAYLGLLFVFAIGGVLFLWHDARVRTVDPIARAIPAMLLFVTWKFVGLLGVVFGGLSFMLHVSSAAERPPEWWVTDSVVILYGLVLSWFTLHRPRTQGHVSSVARPVSAPPSTAKKGPKQAKGKR